MRLALAVCFAVISGAALARDMATLSSVSEVGDMALGITLTSLLWTPPTNTLAYWQLTDGAGGVWPNSMSTNYPLLQATSGKRPAVSAEGSTFDGIDDFIGASMISDPGNYFTICGMVKILRQQTYDIFWSGEASSAKSIFGYFGDATNLNVYAGNITKVWYPGITTGVWHFVAISVNRQSVPARFVRFVLDDKHSVWTGSTADAIGNKSYFGDAFTSATWPAKFVVKKWLYFRVALTSNELVNIKNGIMP